MYYYYVLVYRFIGVLRRWRGMQQGQVLRVVDSSTGRFSYREPADNTSRNI